LLPGAKARMTAIRLPALAALALLSGSNAIAQEREPASAGRKFEALMKRTVSAVGPLMSRPVHPIIGGVGPGGWPGAGIGFDLPTDGRWKAQADGRYTLQRYWSAQVITGYRAKSLKAATYARTREMTKLDFFGVGSASDDEMRSAYRQRDRSVGALGSVRLAPWLSVGARTEFLWFSIGRGQSSDIPSAHEQFLPAEVPGLTSQPTFTHYEGAIDVELPRSPGEGFLQGSRYRMTLGIFDDRQLGRFTFRRTEIEAQQRFALLGPHRRLTLHGWLSMANPEDGQGVPFYLQRTLGGMSSVQSVHELMLGSDDTQGTMRGYRDLRFRGENVLLLQAEYRIPVWGPVDATLFTDWGEAATRRADLRLRQLRGDYGLSLSVMRGPSSVVRIDVGTGGGEGYRVFFTIGRGLLP
jgi:hypothetical protein